MVRLRRLLALFLPLALALVVSAVLFWGTRSADFEKHAAVVESIERQRHLMALLKEDVLASRFNLLRDYDPITQANADSEETRLNLTDATKDFAPQGSELAIALTRLDAAIAERRDRVEHFKSENAILRNSLYYLPVAADTATAKLEAQGGSARTTIQDVNGLVQATLVMNLVGGSERKAAQEARLVALRSTRDDAPDSSKTSLSLLIAHAEKVQSQSGIVDPLVASILSNNVETELNRVERAYGAAFDQSLVRAGRFRAALYLWSLVLILGVLIAVTKLLGLYGKLEGLVAERTRALEQARDALWGEMELAKKIQTALVPAKPTLDGCDVAALMRPADEVGGDYYDVLKIGGVEWVLIGDVSGHGVTAGLVMMMAQTAVRTAIERDPHMAPSRVCALVNRALVENVARLGEKKYMTLLAVRRDSERTFSVAGLHQDLFVYRAATGKVEEIRTRGVWLGIVQDVAPMLEDHTLELEGGDTLLLFTDGVTEASQNGSMFENSRLARVLEKLGKEPAQSIVDGVMKELDGYDVKDDASLVVIRRELSERAN